MEWHETVSLILAIVVGIPSTIVLAIMFWALIKVLNNP